MINVTIVGFEYAFATAITGVMDLFSLAGVTWNRIHGLTPAPRFQVQIATIDGKPFRCANGIELGAHCSFNQVENQQRKPDLILIPTIAGHIDRTLNDNPELIEWISSMYNRNVDIASNCTGSFILARAGLLNGKRATTHWGYQELFRQWFPNVDLQPEQLITSDQNIFCAGGGMAWWDLALHLIERYCDHDLARETAKAYVLDIGRNDQKAYAVVPGKKYHQDETILAVQEWIEGHFASSIHLDSLAEQFNLTPRTFKRRFKAATGDSPLEFIQALRLQQAKKILETESCSIDLIAQRVGYEDQSSFSRLFKRETGMAPGAYRVKFGR